MLADELHKRGNRMRRFALMCALAVFALVAAATASAQSQTWDQAKVTALSGELANAVSNLQSSLQNSAQAQDPVMQETVFQVADSLGLIEFEAARLNALLKSGKGMKETRPAYRRLQQLHRECVDEAQGQLQVTSFLKPSLDRAKNTLTALAAYYPP